MKKSRLISIVLKTHWISLSQAHNLQDEGKQLIPRMMSVSKQERNQLISVSLTSRLRWPGSWKDG